MSSKLIKLDDGTLIEVEASKDEGNLFITKAKDSSNLKVTLTLKPIKT